MLMQRRLVKVKRITQTIHPHPFWKTYRQSLISSSLVFLAELSAVVPGGTSAQLRSGAQFPGMEINSLFHQHSLTYAVQLLSKSNSKYLKVSRKISPLSKIIPPLPIVGFPVLSSEAPGAGSPWGEDEMSIVQLMFWARSLVQAKPGLLSAEKRQFF